VGKTVQLVPVPSSQVLEKAARLKRLSSLSPRQLLALGLVLDWSTPSHRQLLSLFLEMRLINTATLEFTEFVGSDLPEYGILSHTWEPTGEATFEGARAGLLLSGTSQGIQKVRKACELAQGDNLEYCWIDTCCIDKSSSSELTEAINSMFQWYASARVCYAFLSDLRSDQSIDALTECRWFTRGWTLQELIAPRTLRFYDESWTLRGTKVDHAAVVSDITSIDQSILLRHKDLNSIPVGRRMSWAAGRQTTRTEDIAYSLLGIFGVNMPLIYGEGQKAFMRLQEEIIRQNNDLSIFLWTSKCGNKYRGILGQSPDEFKCACSIVRQSVTPSLENPEYIMTNKGVRINISLSAGRDGLLVLWANHVDDGNAYGVFLRPYGDGIYVRANPARLAVAWFADVALELHSSESIRYLSKEVHPEMTYTIDKAMDNAFLLEGNLNTREYSYVSTTPSSWWDHDRKLFLRDWTRPFVAFHIFKSDWDNTMRDNRFVVAFGINDDRSPWFSLGSHRRNPGLFDAAMRGGLVNVEFLGSRRGGKYSSESIQLERRATRAASRLGPGAGTSEVVEGKWTTILTVSLTAKTLHGHKVYCLCLEATQPVLESIRPSITL